jgi:hypothetical protein
MKFNVQCEMTEEQAIAFVSMLKEMELVRSFRRESINSGYILMVMAILNQNLIVILIHQLLNH